MLLHAQPYWKLRSHWYLCMEDLNLDLQEHRLLLQTRIKSKQLALVLLELEILLALSQIDHFVHLLRSGLEQVAVERASEMLLWKTAHPSLRRTRRITRRGA